MYAATHEHVFYVYFASVRILREKAGEERWKKMRRNGENVERGRRKKVKRGFGEKVMKWEQRYDRE